MKEILISTGEYSGDLNASLFIKYFPKEVKFFGMGGKFLKQKGVETLIGIEKSIIGFQEALSNIENIKRKLKILFYEAKKRKTKHALLVDYPGFNLLLAKYLKNLGIKIMYFIPPQIWAWGSWRIKTIKKYVDKVFVIFPFEVKIYKRYGVKSVYVGHPVEWRFRNHKIQIEKKEKYNTIGFLPGSREKEIERLIPRFLKIKEKLKNKNRNLKFLISIVHKSLKNKYKKILNDFEIHENGIEVIKKSDILIIASGTASLECAFLNKPFISVYTLSELSWFFGKLFAKVNYTNLVNILLNKKTIDEFIQRLPIDEIIKSLEKTWERKEEILKDFEKIRNILKPTPEKKIREEIEEFISEDPN